MKNLNSFLCATALLTSLQSLTLAGVLYTNAGPELVNETSVTLPAGLTRTGTAADTLYFKFTVTNPASNSSNENYFAGLQLWEGGAERLGLGNAWDPYAYSVFNTSSGNKDLNSANPEAGQTYQLVRSADIATFVVRVDFVNGANDNVTVWLNPNLSLSESAQNALIVTSFTANATFDNIRLREGGGGSGWSFSNIAIAENSTDAGFFAPPTTTSTWDAGGSDSNWSSATNWLGDTAPLANYDLTFPDSTNTSPINDLTAGTSLAGLTFSAGASAYTLSGNGIILSNYIRNNSSSPQTITFPIQLGGPLAIEAPTSPVFIESSISGSHGITKVGLSRVELTANNTYTGDTSITTGTLSIGNGDVLGSIASTGSIIFGTGTNTRLEIFRSDDISLANAIQTSGRANIAAVVGAKITYSGAVTGTGEFWTYGPGTVKIIPNAGSAAFASSVVVATGALEVEDFSSSTLGTGGFFIGQAGSGTLRYTGGTASTSRIGAYALQGRGVNTFIDIKELGSELTLSQALGENEPGKGLTKTGPGTLNLAAGLTYGGDTVVEQGKLSLSQPGFADSSTITINENALLQLNFSGSDTVSGLVLNAVVMGPGTYTASSHPQFISGTGSLVIPSTDPFPTWMGSFTFSAGADLTKAGDADGDGINNVLEFALDSDPSSSNSSGKVIQKIADGHLTLTLPVRIGATFTGSGPLSTAPPVDMMVYQIEGSENLIDFTSGVTEVIPALSAGLPTLNTGWEYRSFRLTSPISTSSKGFLRTIITTP